MAEQQPDDIANRLFQQQSMSGQLGGGGGGGDAGGAKDLFSILDEALNNLFGKVLSFFTGAKLDSFLSTGIFANFNFDKAGIPPLPPGFNGAPGNVLAQIADTVYNNSGKDGGLIGSSIGPSSGGEGSAGGGGEGGGGGSSGGGFSDFSALTAHSADFPVMDVSIAFLGNIPTQNTPSTKADRSEEISLS